MQGDKARAGLVCLLFIYKALAFNLEEQERPLLVSNSLLTSAARREGVLLNTFTRSPLIFSH